MRLWTRPTRLSARKNGSTAARPRCHKLVEVAALLPSGEIVLVMFARCPALHQDEVVAGIKVDGDFHGDHTRARLSS